MASKETLEKIDYLLKKYLPPWFKEKFYERIYRINVQEDIDLIREFLELINLYFIQPLEFMREVTKNLHEINHDITKSKIELAEGSILIKQDSILLFTQEINYDNVDEFISDFRKLLAELGLRDSFSRM